MKLSLYSGAGLVVCALLLLHGPAGAQTTDRLRKELEGVRVVEQLGARVPLATEFIDEHGDRVTVGAYAGRPILLTLNYSKCPVLCSLQLAGLAKGFKDLLDDSVEPGSYALVTISIDPHDTPQRLKGLEATYVRQTGDYSIAERWHFLSGDKTAIDAVADSIGFSYVYDKEADEYRHQATLAVLTPDGRVSSYLHGVNYRPEDLVDAIARASRGSVFTADQQADLDTALLNCFAYDSNSPSPLALRVMRVGGATTLGGLVLLLAFVLFRGRGRRKAQS